MANIIHLDAKVGFINTCDAMLQARVQGETFGLGIAEFLLRDKPVIASMDGIDKNHLEMLGDRGLFYREPVELFDHLIGFEKAENGRKYRELVAEFSPRRGSFALLHPPGERRSWRTFRGTGIQASVSKKCFPCWGTPSTSGGAIRFGFTTGPCVLGRIALLLPKIAPSIWINTEGCN